MFLSKKCRNFIYTILYLLPFIFLLFFCFYVSFLFNSFNLDSTFDVDIPQFHYIIANFFNTFVSYGNPFKGIFATDIGIFSFDYDSWYLPITNVFNFLFDDFIFSEGNYDFFYGLTFYLDYCIWVSFAIIIFEVITILPVICRKFFNKLGGF